MSIPLLPIVILAGGLATRLRPITHHIPKALIPIHEEPFLFHQLRLLRRHGIQDIVMCIGYLGEQIIDYVGDGKQFDVKIRYSYDGPQLRGTAGAIQQALPLLGDDFFVLYGDSYLPCDYLAAQKYFYQSRKLALMSVFRNQNLWDISNVEFEKNQILAYNKQHPTKRMQYIDYGLGIFNKHAFDAIDTRRSLDLASLYQYLLQKQQLAAFEFKQRFYEVGSFSGIKALEDYLR